MIKTMPGLLARRGDLFPKVLIDVQELSLHQERWRYTCRLYVIDVPAGHQ